MKHTPLKIILKSILLAALSVTGGYSQAQDFSSMTRANQEYKSLLPSFTKSGVYFSNEYVFGVYVKPYESSSRSQDLLEAPLRVSQYFMASCSKQLEGEFSSKDHDVLSTVPGSLRLSGHEIFKGKKGDSFLYVLAVKKTTYQKSCQKGVIFEHINSVKDEVLSSPQNFPRLTEKLGVSEISLLASLKADPSLSPNVGTPTANPFGQIYRAPVPQNEKPYYCLSGEQIKRALIGRKIKTSEVSYRTPILSRVSECQGFVKFSPAQNSPEAPQLPIVRQLFQQGRDLPTVIFLLEAAAEVNLTNPEVWELLEAAYRGAGKMDEARLSGRVWYLTSSKPEEAMKKILSYSDMKNGGDYLREKDEIR